MRNQEYMQGKRAGVKSAIAWLHQRAREMVDPKARDVLNTAAFHLGVKESKTEEAMQLKSQGGTILTTTSTVTIKGPPKEPSWCDQQKIEHCWEDGPTLTIDPPIQTRRCRNCGKSQHLVLEWRDNNSRNFLLTPTNQEDVSMIAVAAAAVLMWLAGLLIGVSAMSGKVDWIVLMTGVILTVLGIIYVRRFAEPEND